MYVTACAQMAQHFSYFKNREVAMYISNAIGRKQHTGGLICTGWREFSINGEEKVGAPGKGGGRLIAAAYR